MVNISMMKCKSDACAQESEYGFEGSATVDFCEFYKEESMVVIW